MKYIIAIDPDVSFNGIAVLNIENKHLVIKALRFAQLSNFISNFGTNETQILVEAGYLNESNWHKTARMSIAAASKIGMNIGRNHETARKIIEILEYQKYNVIEIKPLVKIWGTTAHEKISQREIDNFIPNFPKKSSQDQRDAALIAWIFAGFPIKKMIHHVI